MISASKAERIAAEDRLLEAELATLLGREAGRGRRGDGARSLLAAAAVLLSLAAVIGTWWLQRSASIEAQEPEPAPLPAEVRADRTAALDGLPADTANVACFFDAPADFARAQRLPQLRRLAAWAYDPSRRLGTAGALFSVHRTWSAPPADVLAPFAALPRLERLELAAQLALDGRHLAALRAAPALTHLSVGAAVRIDDDLVAGLAALSHLRALTLRDVALDGLAIARLSRLGLGELRLERCAGLDAAALAALGAMRSLEVLVFEGLGAPPFPRTAAEVAAGATTWHPDGAAFAFLRELPRLRRLVLLASVVDDSALAALPDRLEALELYSTSGYSAAGLRSLARLARLRELRFRERHGYSIFDQHLVPPKDAAAALAADLAAWRLRSFDFTGRPTVELMQALALQPELHSLALADGEGLDLAPLAAAPALAHLRLLNQSDLGDASLEPLARCQSLRSLRAYSSGSITADGAKKLLPGVDVEVVPLDDWLRRK